MLRGSHVAVIGRSPGSRKLAFPKKKTSEPQVGPAWVSRGFEQRSPIPRGSVVDVDDVVEKLQEDPRQGHCSICLAGDF